MDYIRCTDQKLLWNDNDGLILIIPSDIDRRESGPLIINNLQTISETRISLNWLIYQKVINLFHQPLGHVIGTYVKCSMFSPYINEMDSYARARWSQASVVLPLKKTERAAPTTTRPHLYLVHLFQTFMWFRNLSASSSMCSLPNLGRIRIPGITSSALGTCPIISPHIPLNSSVGDPRLELYPSFPYSSCMVVFLFSLFNTYT